MTADEHHGAPGGLAASSSTAPFLATLAQVDEATRFRLLADFVGELAEQATGSLDRVTATAEIEALSRRVKEHAEEKATLQDRLRGVEVELEQRDAKLGIEKETAEKYKSLADQQTSRLEELQVRTRELEDLLDARSRDIHKANVEHESITLQLQRADSKGQDKSKEMRLEEQHRALEGENERLRGEIEQLRKDKNVEIEKVSDDLLAAKEEASAKQDVEFDVLWARLAGAKPPLAEGHLKPNMKSGERLFDSYVELVKFVDDFDKLMRPFLSRYTAARPRLKAVWEAYARGSGIRETAKQIIVPEGGRPTGILRNQLRGLYKWTEAAVWGSEAAVESIGTELPTFMRRKDSFGCGSDSSRKLTEFILENGPDAFSDHMKAIRSAKIAQFFGVNVQ
ncbi:MAG: hypothetical protein IH987_09520 [Planctomycetes bacterium]|nr:hypothetical protein [Planctomycetota bacterium]